MEENKNIIILKDKDIENLKLIKNGELGTNSKIYMYNDTECLKMFNDPILFSNDLDKFLSFPKLEFKTTVAPKKIVFISDEFRGYISNFIDGPMLNECGNLDFSYVVKKYSEFVKKASEEIADYKFIIKDATSRNIILDNMEDSFKLIDIDYWLKMPDFSFNLLKERNFMTLNIYFALYIFCPFSKIHCDTDLVDYYETFRREEEKKNNVKIKTLREFRSYSSKDIWK